MAYCTNCGAPLSDGVFCPSCGANNAQTRHGGIKCPFCGAIFPNNTSICPVCNKNIYASPISDSLHQIGSGIAGVIDGALNSINKSVRSDPPLNPVSTSGYHVICNGQSTGPYTLSTLQSMAQSRQLTWDTPVWKPGMPQWTTAGNVQELQFILNSVPPAY